MSYLSESSKYLLNNVSALHVGGYLKDHDDFKLSVLLNDKYEFNKENINELGVEVINELPPTWFNKVSLQVIENKEDKTISSVIVIFKNKK